MLNTDAAIIRMTGRTKVPWLWAGRHGAAQKTPISAVAAAGKNQIHFSVSTPMQYTAKKKGHGDT